MQNKYFLKNFVLKSNEYTLTKTEVSFRKAGKPNTRKTIKLNELNPYYESIHYVPLYSLLLLTIFSLGFLTALGFIIFGHAQIQADNIIRMIWGVFILLLAGYFFKKNYTAEWRFYYHFRPGIAFSIKYSNKTKYIAQQLVDAIAQQIKRAEKSNEHIVWLLTRYSLLTEREYDLLQAKIMEQKVPSQLSTIIDITERLK